MPDAPLSTPPPAASFNEQHRALVKEAIRELAEKALEGGADAMAMAQVYSEKGKPEFVLAYLLRCDLPDEEKRELLASAYETRAAHSEEWARTSEARYNRPFPLVHLEAQKDRSNARLLRAGKAARKESKAARQLNLSLNN
jgi:hypothetical protein